MLDVRMIDAHDDDRAHAAKRTSIVQIFDRRVLVFSEQALNEGALPLYSILRAWFRDDPSMTEPMIEQEQTIDSDQRSRIKLVGNVDRIKLIAGDKVLADAKELFKTQYVKGESDRRLHDHIKSFKKIRNRNKLVCAARYCKLKDRLDEMKIPRLVLLDNILEECQALSLATMR